MRHGLWIGLLALGLGSSAAADAATCTWGGSSGNWSVGANWSGCGGSAPGVGDTAVISSGTPQVDVPSTVAGLTITGGGLGGAQNLTVTAAFVWSGGSLSGPAPSTELILDAGCTSTFGPSGSARGISNRALRNRGTFHRADSTGTITLSNAAEIVNEGVWNGGASNWIATGSGSGVKRFTNAATAQYNHASGNSYLAVEVVNSGTLSVAAGVLQLSGGGTLAATQTLAAGATLEVQTAALNISSGATFGGAGLLRIIGGTLTFNGSVSVPNLAIGGGVVNGAGTPTITGGLNWYANAILQGSGLADQMILDAGSVNTFSVPSNAPTLQNRTLVNRGNMTQQASTASLYFAGAAEIVNEGVWIMDTNTSFTIGSGAGGKRFRNEAGATLSKVGAGTSTIGPELTNAGSLQITVDTTLGVNTFTQSAGMTTLASDGYLQQMSTPLAFQGGYLRGVGSVLGSVTNSGATVAPGTSPGTLTITGSYTQSGAGVLEIEIAGAAAAQFDQLDVSAAASLAGTVSFVLLGGFVPAPTDSFQFLSFSSRSGYFSASNNPAAATHFVSYGANDAVLTASGSNGELQLAVCSLRVYEGNQLGIAVTRSGGLDVASASWTTASVNASAGVDYLPTSGTVSVDPGASRGTLWIDIPADAEAEGPEEFIVQLQTGSAGVTVTPRTLVVRILNGEGLYLDGFESGCAAP
ncbi:MAG: hypothetical protein HYV17_03385 [Xanthomonadales bacterium]|nr:hypothetical protein [Xanthomonadales bacterium]